MDNKEEEGEFQPATASHAISTPLYVSFCTDLGAPTNTHDLKPAAKPLAMHRPSCSDFVRLTIMIAVHLSPESKG